MRDSVDKPRMTKTTSAPACAMDVGTTLVKAWVAPSPKVQANKQQRAASCEALRRRVQVIGTTLATRDGKPSAKDRLAWLAKRVRAKASRRAQGTLGMGSCSGGVLPGFLG